MKSTLFLWQWSHSGVFIVNFEQILHIIVFIVDFEQENAGWEVSKYVKHG